MSKRTSSSRNPKPTSSLSSTASTPTNHDLTKNNELESKNVAKTKPSNSTVNTPTNHDRMKNKEHESKNVAKTKPSDAGSTSTNPTKTDVLTQPAPEPPPQASKVTPMVSGCQPTSHLAEPQIGIYVDRFGMQKIIGQVTPQNIPVPEYPTGSQTDIREIEIRTRRLTSELCRYFSHGYCEWGGRCKHIHCFNTRDRGNNRVLREVFQGSHPEIADSQAFYNQACRLFIDGRCNMDWRCKRVHLIPPPQTSATNSESTSNSLAPSLEPEFRVNIPRAVPYEKLLKEPGTYLDTPELSTNQNIQSVPSSPSVDAEKVAVKIASSDRALPESDRWGHATDLDAWLASDSIRDEIKISSVAWSNGTDLELQGWGFETDVRAWLTDSESSDTSTDSTDSNHSLTFGSESCSGNAVKHPPPRYSEICRRWLRGECERGYNCSYVHNDLEYDKSISEARSVPPTYYVTYIYDHIRIKLGAGFSIQEIVTGFETPWLYLNNIPLGTSDDDISRLLARHGTVQDVFVSGSPKGTLRARARFSNHVDARNANIILNGTRQWGSIISTQLPVNSARGGSATFEDTAVRIEWEAPSIVGYGGYPTEERANNAVAIAKAAYSSTYISAHLYTGLPQMGPFTVRFRNLPLDTKKEHMRKYAQPLDMMWDMPNYTSTIDAVAYSLRRKFDTNGISVSSFDVLPPPYRDGLVRAWAHFPSSSVAKAACQLLHLRKPMITGKTRIFAYHMQTLSYSMPLDQYQKVEDQILTFRDRLWNTARGTTTFTIIHSGASVIAKLSAVDGKDLGHLKTEFEKLRGGEVVRHDGEVLWDRFFGLPVGKVYLRKLENAHIGLTIRDDASRRRLTLFGQATLRETVKAILIKKHTELSVRVEQYITLGPVLGPFMRYDFDSLSKRMGPENVSLDLWNRRLVVMVTNNQDSDFRVALQAVQRRRHMQNPHLRLDVASCPVCLAEVDCPVTIPLCKHSYCRTCLVSYFQAAIDSKFFPLTCLGNDDNCSSLLPISLARQVLSTGEFESLVEAAFQSHIHERPKEFHYCPSPNCMQVYRPAPRGNILQCPSCLLRICPQCHVEQHDGFECPDRDDGDHLFDEWAKAHDVKNCPECSVPIERAEGCNHVTCIRCRTHICWVCLGTFPGGDGIYNHMRAEHGGIGNAFDADGL